MALTHERRVMPPTTRYPSDLAADARMDVLVWSLPASVRRRLDFHLFLGRGTEGERGLLAQMAELEALDSERGMGRVDAGSPISGARTVRLPQAPVLGTHASLRVDRPTALEGAE